MDNLLIFVKLNSSEAVRPAIEYVKDSYLHHRERFYYTSNLDTTTISDLLETRGIQQLTGCHIVFIEYRKVPEIFIKKLDALDPNSHEYMEIKQYCEKCINEYTEKKKILVRAICDFISGMTDTYAINEYRKLIC